MFNDTYSESSLRSPFLRVIGGTRNFFGAAGFEPTLEAPKAPALPLDDAPTWC